MAQQEGPDPDADRRTEVSGVRSTVAIGGHPIHPMLIPLPIGALVGAVVTDLVFWSTDNGFWAEMSWWLLWAGLVTGLVAAAAGMVELLTIHRVRSHLAGRVHLITNAAALVLVGLNLVVRAGDHAASVLPAGLVLSLVVASLLGVGGWFGGELTFRHGVGVTGHDHSG